MTERLLRLPWARLRRLGLGTLAMGIGIAFLVVSRLGMTPMDALHLALAHAFGWDLGRGILLAQGVLLLTFVPLRLRPGVGTVAGFVVPAFTADTVLALLPPPTDLAWRLIAVIGGGLLFCGGVALYLSSQLGQLPRDGIMLALGGDRNATGGSGRRLALVRIGIDAFFVAVATLILGPGEAVRSGVLGGGTLALALLSGPLIVRGLKYLGRISEFARRPPGRHRAAVSHRRQRIAAVRSENS